MSNIVPQPQVTFENNKIYIDSPVDVKYTLDGLDPVFYGVIYSSPISISHTTTIKAISVNSLGEYSNLVAGTFTPESDVSDGSSGSTWNPSYDDAVTLEELSAMSYVTSYALESASYATTTYVADYVSTYGGGGGSIDLSSYVTYDYLESQSYITINDVPTIDTRSYVTDTQLQSYLSSYVTDTQLQSYLSSYVTYSFLNSQSYVTNTALENASYATQSYVADYVSTYSSGGNIDLSSYVTYDFLYNQSYATQSYVLDKVNGIPSPDLSSYVSYSYLADSLSSYVTKTELNNAGYISSIPSEYITETELSNCGYLTQHQDLSGYLLAPSFAYSGQMRLTNAGLGIDNAGMIFPETSTYAFIQDRGGNRWISAATLKNYVEGRIADIESTYATTSYVANYIASYAPAPDLSSYVTKTELSNAGYLTSVPNTYPTYTAIQNMGYVTQTNLNNAGYITTSVSNLSNYYTKTNINNASYTSKTQVNGMFSFDSTTGTLTITTIS